MITEPGVYDLSAEVYHGQPCPELSLSSTGARTLISECPAAYRYGVQEPKTEFEIGNAAHLLCLQPEDFAAHVVEIEQDDYRTKDARAARDEARAAGKIPLLPAQATMVRAMRNAIMADPVGSLAFRNGKPEQSLFWRDPEFGIWCKTRPDWLPDHRRYLVDIKTTTCAAPAAFTKAIASYGYHQQAAWYLDGVEAVFGVRPERFAFVAVEKKEPYLVSTFWLDEEAIGWGRILNRKARGLFAWCLRNDTWPGYRPDPVGAPGAFTASLPSWTLKDLQIRHEAGEFEPPHAMEDAA